jgi:hypothetical protein
MVKLLPLVGLVFFAPLDYTIPVAVEAAFVVATQANAAPVSKCCGLCTGGKIVHGDGHATDCPCPPTCDCKKRAALVHPPTVLHCKDGKCSPKK